MKFSLKALFVDLFSFLWILGFIYFLIPTRFTETSIDLFGIGLLLTSCVAALILQKISFMTSSPSLGLTLFSAPFLNSPESHPAKSRIWMCQTFIWLSAVFILGWNYSQISIYELLDPDGFKAMTNLFANLASPDWSILPQALSKIFETILIAFMGTALAVPVAFLFAFFSAKNLMNSPKLFVIYATTRILFNLTRSIEPIIWAIIFSVWVGIGPFAGMLALMIQSIASLTKQFSEIIETVDEGPLDSIRSVGASPIQVIWYGVVPQVLLPYISFTLYRWDTNVRMATIIGFAGGGGIGTLLNQYSLSAQWPQVGCLILIIAAVVWIMDIISAYFREALK